MKKSIRPVKYLFARLKMRICQVKYKFVKLKMLNCQVKYLFVKLEMRICQLKYKFVKLKMLNCQVKYLFVRLEICICIVGNLDLYRWKFKTVKLKVQISHILAYKWHLFIHYGILFYSAKRRLGFIRQVGNLYFTVTAS